MELGGKAAFVTGGSGDIGGAIARSLAKAGVDVAVSYVSDSQRAGATVEAVKKIGRRSIGVQSHSVPISSATLRGVVFQKTIGPPIQSIESPTTATSVQ